MATSYDEVLYPSGPIAQTHPARLAAVAALYGLTSPPPERCRVLELGCGDGSNLIPLALEYPESRFLGLDLAGSPIAAGQAWIAKLGLQNACLQQMDLLDWDPANEQFDYVVAHGLYSWAPESVRQKILAICGRCLPPCGVAFISYNAYPGCHFREIVWDFLRLKTRGISDPKLKIAEARAAIRKFLENLSGEPEGKVLRIEFETLLERSDGAIYHDDLGPVNQPFHLTEFIRDAGGHGLQYLSDADLHRDEAEGSPEECQYADFAVARRFRETLLCRDGRPLSRAIQPGGIQRLWLASRAEPQPEATDGSQKFELGQGKTLTTNHPAAKQLLYRLWKAWPQSIPAGDIPVSFLLRLLEAKVVEIRSSPPRLVSSVSARPVSGPLARLQIASGRTTVTNLRHANVDLEDALLRRLVSLLDGTRDRSAILVALTDAVASGIAIPGRASAPETRGEIESQLEADLDARLQSLGQICLLAS